MGHVACRGYHDPVSATMTMPMSSSAEAEEVEGASKRRRGGSRRSSKAGRRSKWSGGRWETREAPPAVTRDQVAQVTVAHCHRDGPNTQRTHNEAHTCNTHTHHTRTVGTLTLRIRNVCGQWRRRRHTQCLLPYSLHLL